MRSRRVPIILSSVLGCTAVALGLIPAVAPAPVAQPAAAHADAVPAIR